MINVGIIGCGKIADSHAEQIRRIEGCRIVGVCDREELMAKQLAERFHVERYFHDVRRFLDESRPTVVHITTPPQGHFALGKMCLEAGCHVYVEKPFAVNTAEAEELIGIATAKKLKITAGHDDQYSHAARRMRELIHQGYLGGSPVHMESYYCYDLGDQQYAKALLGDKQHWVRALPGTLMQNNISHGISRIAEFMPDDDPVVIANGFVSPLLRGMGELDIIDEVRVIISNDRNTTAYFTFSTQMRPTLRHFRIYGTRNGLMMDHDQQTLIKIKGSKHKSYLEKFIPLIDFSSQYAANFLKNMHSFLKMDFHMKSGMKFLIESFYRSIADNTEPPIPYREIILTSRIMDSIFNQISP
ncbi:MAG: Gfo/Idh/MocA family oxidoreductase [Nitrospirae bacterium]|nr:Gfo/Idh/MocA family oxidoreductase [Nitrospirota bacterium]